LESRSLVYKKFPKYFIFPKGFLLNRVKKIFKTKSASYSGLGNPLVSKNGMKISLDCPLNMLVFLCSLFNYLSTVCDIYRNRLYRIWSFLISVQENLFGMFEISWIFFHLLLYLDSRYKVWIFLSNFLVLMLLYSIKALLDSNTVKKLSLVSTKALARKKKPRTSHINYYYVLHSFFIVKLNM
jgi:hypothetical protein